MFLYILVSNFRVNRLQWLATTRMMKATPAKLIGTASLTYESCDKKVCTVTRLQDGWSRGQFLEGGKGIFPFFRAFRTVQWPTKPPVQWLLEYSYNKSNEMEHPDATSKQSAKRVSHIPTVACTVLDSWWWTENLSEHEEFYSKNKFEN
jgi:hypothetical protein